MAKHYSGRYKHIGVLSRKSYTIKEIRKINLKQIYLIISSFKRCIIHWNFCFILLRQINIIGVLIRKVTWFQMAKTDAVIIQNSLKNYH